MDGWMVNIKSFEVLDRSRIGTYLDSEIQDIPKFK